MKGKIAWRTIYTDFRSRHPRLKQEAIGWEPFDVMKIKIWFKDKSIMIYDYFEHKGTWLISPKC
jgi:hypothetical protein